MSSYFLSKSAISASHEICRNPHALSRRSSLILPLTKSICTTAKPRAYRSPYFMAPDEEKMTKRSPLDFPVELERPGPGRRPDIFPQFSPLKPPLPRPMPGDPPPEDEDEEEEEKEEEKDPETKPDQPEE